MPKVGAAAAEGAHQQVDALIAPAADQHARGLDPIEPGQPL